jgi:mxaK protein
MLGALTRLVNRRRLRQWALPLLAVLLAALAAQDAWRLNQARRFNTAVDGTSATSATAQPLSRDQPSPMLFARAWRAAQADRVEEALALYTAAAADPQRAAQASYNAGNLHLRQALALAERNALAQTPQPAEMAKRMFRMSLQADPTFWPARYNLERALRLAPEGEEDAPLPPPQQSERAVTTMRGFTLGLP